MEKVVQVTITHVEDTANMWQKLLWLNHAKIGTFYPPAKGSEHTLKRDGSDGSKCSVIMEENMSDAEKKRENG